MLHYVLQPRRHQHEGRIAVREGPDGPRPPPDLAVDAPEPVVRPDPASVLRREFRVGKRLGEPVARRPRGRTAELRHAELDFPDVRDEPSRVVAAAVDLTARRPFIALGPDKLGRLLVEQRVERPLVYRCDVRRRGPCLLSSVICCLVARNHMTGRGPYSVMRLSICERNYVSPREGTRRL